MSLSPEPADRKLWALRRITMLQAASTAVKLGALLLLVVLLARYGGRL